VLLAPGSDSRERRNEMEIWFVGAFHAKVDQPADALDMGVLEGLHFVVEVDLLCIVDNGTDRLL
jgi:hypothetical protein